MFSTWRSRALSITAVSAALVGGVIVAPQAMSASLTPTSVAASFTPTTREPLAIDLLHNAVTVQRTAVAKAQAQAAAVAQVAKLRTTAVKIALSRKGMSYSAGSSGPTAFDCSGFTSYVWRTAGKTIARTSYDQFATLPKITRAQAKPGDLVFFFGNGAHHVGFYLGNNRMIHAANYGSGVIITKLTDNWYASRISGFRRVV